MFDLILFQPEIPPNTGNIIRLCANTGSRLHLIHPLGFELDDRRMRRAGLDYHEFAALTEHDSLDACLAALGEARVFALSTHGQRSYAEVDYRRGDAFLFGPETRGLPADVRSAWRQDRLLRIPMQADSRSMNLLNAAAVMVYEAWRQLGFGDGV